MSVSAKKVQAEVKQLMTEYGRVTAAWRHTDLQIKAILDAAASLGSHFVSIQRTPLDILTEEQHQRLLWRVMCDLEDLFQQLRQFQ